MTDLIRRLVVKVGSSTLTTREGSLDRRIPGELSAVLAEQHRAGVQVVLVTSGAVATGVDRLGIERPRTVPHKQAAAAVGQGILMGLYTASLEQLGINAGQILLTRQDVSDRARYTNASNTFEALFRFGALPIVNENDSVAVDEIRFGDNDELASIVAFIVDADLVIILSDVAGLYDPAREPGKVIPVVDEVNSSVEHLARPVGSNVGTGGMVTKLAAARALTRAGIPLILGPGQERKTVPDSVDRWTLRVSEGEDRGWPGTLFLPAPRRLRGRKRWIAFGSRTRGTLVVNEKASAALLEDRHSLLAAGVMEVAGHFQAGDPVRIVDTRGHEVGRGLVNYSIDEMRLICGCQSHEIKTVLGRDTLTEVIHRDNLVVGI